MKAIILAGGQSTRFGSPKAFAKLNNNEMFYQRILKVLEETNMFEDIIISTNASLATHFDHAHVVVDDAIHKDKGPLAGIYSAMQAYPDEQVYFVISVDTPFVHKKAINYLYQYMMSHLFEDQLEIAGFEAEGYKIPTIAFYRASTMSVIENVLNSDDLSMKHVFDNVQSDWLDVKSIDGANEWYKNINYQQDLAEIQSNDHS